jgi:hypothetical protein
MVTYKLSKTSSPYILSCEHWVRIWEAQRHNGYTHKLAVQTHFWGNIQTPEEHTLFSSILKHFQAPFAIQTNDGLITSRSYPFINPHPRRAATSLCACLLLGSACP